MWHTLLYSGGNALSTNFYNDFDPRMLRVFDSMLEGIMLLDENMVIQYANKSYLEYTKLDKEQIVGQYLPSVRPGAVTPRVFKTKKAEYNFHRVFDDGTQSYSDSIPILEDGKVVAGLTVTRDIKVLNSLFNSIKEKEKHISQLSERVKELKYTARYAFDAVIGSDSHFCEIARKVAPTDSSVLLVGESGTGKEVMAQAIHNASHRRDQPFVDVNCAALPESLIESELFGYVPGAFTSAHRNGKIGLFELAQGGTIFLDEITEMPLPLQGKLLRVIQERQMRRIGGNQNIQLNVRMIAATNRDIENAMASGTFRQDLFYRLAVAIIKIPPLRERAGHIDAFIQAFIREQEQKTGRSYTVSAEARQIMRKYSWPGNVRQLQNAVEYGCMASVDGQIIPQTLPYYLLKDTGAYGKYAKSESLVLPGESLSGAIDRMEKEILQERLRKQGTSLAAKKDIAASLGIGIATLYNKLQKHGLQQK
ncbi:MAG: Anaerobic nitric oxide reductase transcription regulator NorR [Desulfovibrio sp.]